MTYKINFEKLSKMCCSDLKVGDIVYIVREGTYSHPSRCGIARVTLFDGMGFNFQYNNGAVISYMKGTHLGSMRRNGKIIIPITMFEEGEDIFYIRLTDDVSSGSTIPAGELARQYDEYMEDKFIGQ